MSSIPQLLFTNCVLLPLFDCKSCEYVGYCRWEFFFSPTSLVSFSLYFFFLFPLSYYETFTWLRLSSDCTSVCVEFELLSWDCYEISTRRLWRKILDLLRVRMQFRTKPSPVPVKYIYKSERKLRSVSMTFFRHKNKTLREQWIAGIFIKIRWIFLTFCQITTRNFATLSPFCPADHVPLHKILTEIWRKKSRELVKKSCSSERNERLRGSFKKLFF